MVDRVRLLTVVVFAVMLGSNCTTEVAGSSTISQSYEHTVYIAVPGKGTLALFTYRVGVSIQTEIDGAWRENSRYEGIFSVQLEWYDSTLFPFGISIVFPKNNLHMLGFAYLPSDFNETVYWEGLTSPNNVTVDDFINYDYYVVEFGVGQPTRGVRLNPRAGYCIYNATFPETQIGSQRWFCAQNGIYITVRPEEAEPLSESTFQDFSDNVDKTLSSLQAQVFLLEIAVIVITLITIVLLLSTIYFARRKPHMPTG